MLQKCSGKLYSTDWTEKSTFFKYVHWEGEAAFTVHGLCLLTLPTGKKDLVLALCCSSYLALPNEKLWNSLLCFVYLTFNWHKLDLVCFFSLKTISISAQSWALSYLFLMPYFCLSFSSSSVPSLPHAWNCVQICHNVGFFLNVIHNQLIRNRCELLQNNFAIFLRGVESVNKSSFCLKTNNNATVCQR